MAAAAGESATAALADGDFHATSAQVIPVLFIALIVEFRFVDPRVYSKGGNAFTQLAVLLALGLGEAAALRALYYATPATLPEDSWQSVWRWEASWSGTRPSSRRYQWADRHRSRSSRQFVTFVAAGTPAAYLGALIYALVHGI